MSTLFDEAAREAAAAGAPLAVRMRPRTLDEVVGQRHLLGPGTPLRRLVEGDAPMSLILWGPPGTGKTTIAHVVSLATQRTFVQLSALSAGVKEVRAVIADARRELGYSGRQTVLFIDEVHRFSKTQQDSLLGAVEDRIVSLVGATTENPFFSVVSPLLSRSLLLTLEPLSEADIGAVIDRALTDDRGLSGRLRLAEETRDNLIRLAGGDARRALTMLEAGAGAVAARGRPSDAEDVPHGADAGDGSDNELDLATLESSVNEAAVRYDREGDQHYDVTSAFIKSIRGSDVDAALHYLARMTVAGEDPRFIARRLMILASEDIGMADPTALTTAVAAAQAVAQIGMPEGRLILAQAVIHLSTAAKSNAVIMAVDAAIADVRNGQAGSVPAQLRDAHYPGAQRLEHGAGYRYSHDEPGAVARQQYPPDELVGRDYYRPTCYGAEQPIAERVRRLRVRVRGAAEPRPAAPDGTRPAAPDRTRPAGTQDNAAGEVSADR